MLKNCITWFHPKSNTTFQSGYLEGLFLALQPLGQGTFNGFKFSSWDDFEIVKTTDNQGNEYYE